eukprot:scaffold184_cov316-Pinguiococcus_pyrenoidosus.AAC.7
MAMWRHLGLLCLWLVFEAFARTAQIGVADVTVRIPPDAEAGDAVYSAPFVYNSTLWRLQLYPKGRHGYAARNGYWSCYLERLQDAQDAAKPLRCTLFSAPKGLFTPPRAQSYGISFDLALRTPRDAGQTAAKKAADPYYFCSAHSFDDEEEEEAHRKGALVFGTQEMLQGQDEVTLRARLGPAGMRTDSYDAIVGPGSLESGLGIGAALTALKSTCGGVRNAIYDFLVREVPLMFWLSSSLSDTVAENAKQQSHHLLEKSSELAEVAGRKSASLAEVAGRKSATLAGAAGRKSVSLAGKAGRQSKSAIRTAGKSSASFFGDTLRKSASLVGHAGRSAGATLQRSGSLLTTAVSRSLALVGGAGKKVGCAVGGAVMAPFRLTIPMPWSAPYVPLPTGLVNLCNTCYMNSVLQSMYAVEPFREAVLHPERSILAEKPANGETYEFSKAFLSLRQTFFAMAGEEPTPLPHTPEDLKEGEDDEEGDASKRRAGKAKMYKPDSLAKDLGIDVRIQQDAQEFIRLLVDALGRGSDVDFRKICGGQAVTTIRAPDADFEKKKMETFQDLSLDVLGMKSLDEALKRYISADVLDGDNKYNVKGQGYFRAERFTRLVSPLPEVLQFHLKRFAFNLETGQMRKVTSQLDFPTDLDMSAYLAEEEPTDGTTYELSSVVVHIGDVDRGHYYAFTRAPGSGESSAAGSGQSSPARWYRINDDDVREVSVEAMQKEAFGSASKRGAKLMTPTAYLVQYTKKRIPPPSD